MFSYGARHSRLHWSFDGARLEAKAWAEEMDTGRVDQATVEGGIAIGRIRCYALVLRGIPWPAGPPPASC